MGTEEALELLRGGAQGIEKWNAAIGSGSVPELLAGATLCEVDLGEADLRGANLSGADLGGSDLGGANLSGANMMMAQLPGVNLSRAILRRAFLTGANLSWASLIDADLREAHLREADLREAYLENANLSGAWLGETLLCTSLRDVHGLGDCIHILPSYIPLVTLASIAKAPPKNFLRGCGLSPWEVESARLLNPDLSFDEIQVIANQIAALRIGSPVQIRPAFISYSHKDRQFVDQLQSALLDAGINVWHDVHDAEAGPMEPIIRRAMENRLVILVLSGASGKSNWVEHELTLALSLERKQGRQVLLPIQVNRTWRDGPLDPVKITQLEKKHIVDFTKWRDPERFQEGFRKIERGIREWYT